MPNDRIFTLAYPRSMDRVRLEREGRSTRTKLIVGSTETLFIDGVPWAVFDGNEVTFPDVPYPSKHTQPETLRSENFMTPSIQRAINEFWTDHPHIRESAANFDYQLARALMSQLRPLTRTGE